MRILIVEDEPYQRQTLCDILEDDGYSVSVAKTGLDAVRQCENEAFDVALLDIKMPGINGVETFIRIMENHKNIRTILMTAYAEEELENEALAAGAAAILRKPLDIDQLRELIKGG